MSELVRVDEAGVPANYKPEESMKRMAIADAAAQMFMKAKNAEGLRSALHAKLKEQRDFVIWWDAQEKDPGGRPQETLNTSVKGKLND